MTAGSIKPTATATAGKNGSVHVSKADKKTVFTEFHTGSDGNITHSTVHNINPDGTLGTNTRSVGTSVKKYSVNDTDFAGKHASRINTNMQEVVTRNTQLGLNRQAGETENQHANRIKVYKRAQAHLESQATLTEDQYKQKLNEMGATHRNNITSQTAARESREAYNNHLDKVITGNSGILGISGTLKGAVKDAEKNLQTAHETLLKAGKAHTPGNEASYKLLKEAEQAYKEAKTSLVTAKEAAVAAVKAENDNTANLLKARTDATAIANENALKVTKLYGQEKVAAENKKNGTKGKPSTTTETTDFEMPKWALDIVGHTWEGMATRGVSAVVAFLTLKWLLGGNQTVVVRPAGV